MIKRYKLSPEQVPAENQRSYVEYQGRGVTLFNIDGQLHAIDDSCPHQGASLYGGRLEKETIQCCAHGLRFNLRTGYMLNSKHVKLSRFNVEKTDGRVFIIFPEET
ncbi:Rieske 2Fe-2S domain-containing protein [Amphritea atlantica]|uniref:Rieske 2Fe-2S domain-containing protein n=1 Tax=Amphritea atlantica TaxID=355243 RepID=A0ABY5GSX2_9GAMM|nr:Rieske 2Fe-2S domain-containing protein [Amphritea atlantica]